MANSRVQPIRLSQDLLEAIEAHPDYRPAAEGIQGGLSAWIRLAIHEKLGRPVPESPHAQQSRKYRSRREAKDSGSDFANSQPCN